MPVVSIGMITFRHEQFIEQAVLGILDQKTDFPFELVILDDQSPDNTASIINHIIATHPNGNWIKYQQNASNVGVMANFINCINACSANYIALCEGDDYWTDPFKLQKQYTFLEQHPDYSGCFHQVDYYNQVTGMFHPLVSQRIPSHFTLNDLLIFGNAIPTCSIMFRRKVLLPVKTLLRSPFADYILHIENLKLGSYGYLNDKMGVYRIHEGGVHGADLLAGKNNRRVYAKEFFFWKLIIDDGLLPKKMLEGRFNQVAELALNELVNKSNKQFLKLWMIYFRYFPRNAYSYFRRKMQAQTSL